MRVGIFLSLGSLAVAELVAESVDFVVIDAEHGTYTDTDLFQILSVLKPVSSRWIRLDSRMTPGKGFDLGANGILVPQLRSVRQVEDIVRTSYLPPRGRRGLGPGPSVLFGKHMDMAYSLDKNNEVWIQIETMELLNDLETVLNVPNVSGYFIGPGDLSAALGVPGEFTHPVLLQTIERIIESCRRYQRPWGIFAPDINMAEKWKKVGAELVLIGSDASALINGLQSIAEWGGRQQ